MQTFNNLFDKMPTMESEAKAPSQASDGNGGQSLSDMFLTLLVTQLQHQDPTAPVDPSQIVTQLAQVAQATALQSMTQSTLASIATQTSMLVVTLGAQVGSQVMVSADSVQLAEQPIKGGFVLKDSTSDTKLVLTGPDGVEHPIELGPQQAGEVSFDIDPEKLGLPPGKYAMRVDTNTGEKVSTEIQGELQSVRVGEGGQIVLKVAGIGEVAVSDISRFLGHPENNPAFHLQGIP